MKKIFLAFIALSITMTAFAQNDDQMQYRRNSLSVAFIDDFTTTNSSETSIVRETMDKYQISDKYNDHAVGDKIVRLRPIGHFAG